MILLAALAVAVVFAAGTFLLLQRDLTRVVVGVILISNSAVLFIIAAGLVRGEAPIYPLPEEGLTGAGISDPLVQAMALTALIIGFSIAALLLAIIYRVYVTHRTVDLEEISAIEMRYAEALEAEEDPEEEELPAEEQDAEPEDAAETQEGAGER
ncbi:MAG: NADH-quinone oxidoreductase subunit K [Rubrobacter sp.]|nr:NADH-quinone oxidoreductase subunit K [Rubrobacter sp.]